MTEISRRIDWSRVRRQFREDYQFAMIVLFGLLASVVVTGFVIYRYAFGFYFGGTVNLMIVTSMLLVLVYALKSGRTRRAGIFFCAATVVACIASTAMFGRTGILWGYVVLWVNFLLTSRRFALVASRVHDISTRASMPPPVARATWTSSTLPSGSSSALSSSEEHPWGRFEKRR